MQPNPFSALLKSRKFWLMFIDAVVSLVTFFVGRHLVPALAEEIIIVIGILQPVVIFVIKGITEEDVAKSNALAFQDCPPEEEIKG